MSRLLMAADIRVVVRVTKPDTCGRERIINQLREQLGESFDSTIRVSVPGTHPAASYRASLTHDLVDHEWVLHLEDNAYLAPCFWTSVLRLLSLASQRGDLGLVTFYSGRHVQSATRLAPDPILDIVPGRTFMMTQAVAFPVSRLGDHNDFVGGYSTPTGKPWHADVATQQWLKHRRLKIGVSWPSVAQRVVWDRGADRPRVASGRSSPSYQLAFGDPGVSDEPSR